MTPETNRVLKTISAIQSGNKQAREEFLAEYKPFVAKTAMLLCKRPLEWGKHDELSIAFIAFNDALDSYDKKKQVPFMPYAKIVVQNRLKDYFRKQSRLMVERPLDTQDEDGKTISPADIQSAWDDFKERTIESERQDELAEYEELLSEFGIDFEALVEVSPKHKDSRQTLLKTAKAVADDNQLMKLLIKKKQLPINELLLRTGINRKTIERGRKFIIAAALILFYRMEYPYLRAYINLDATS
jgi:RNA polymerase sigma factor